MNCKRCGSVLEPTDIFCKGCGMPSVEMQAMADETNQFNVGQTSLQQTNVESNVQPNSAQYPNVGVEQPTELLDMSAIKQNVNIPSATNSVQQPIMGQNPYGNQQPTVNQNPYGGQPSFVPNMNNQNNNYNSMGSNYEPPKKKNLMMPIIVTICVLLVIAIAVVVTVIFVNGNKENDDPNQIVDVTTYKVNFGGYTLSVPEDYLYQVKDGILFIGDEASTWAVQLSVVDAVYSTVLANKNNIKLNFENAGCISTNAVEKTISQRKFLVVEVEQSQQKQIIAYTKASSTQIFALSGYNSSNTYDESIIEKISSTISSAAYNGASNNIQIDGIPNDIIINAFK